MSVVCVIQARMGSSRMPGKVLAEIADAPMLTFMVERLAPLPWPVVVATTDVRDDDAVAAIARASGAEVVRGSEHDVLDRFVTVLDHYPAETLVRLTGDCPLADPEVVSEAVALRERTGADYVSNTLVRTFPDGLDVEVVDAGALRQAAAEATDLIEREHVTPFVYRRPERFRLRSLRRHPPLGHLRWTVDRVDDLARVQRIAYELGGRTHFTWVEALGVPAASEGSRPVEVDGVALRPAIATDETFLLQLRNDDESVRWSRSGQPVDPAGHTVWFATMLDDPSSRIWIGERAGPGDGPASEPLGQVRVDVEAGVGVVSISVASAARGRGVGTALLRGLLRALRADHQVHTVVAEVHEDNERSRRLFDRVGFRVDPDPEPEPRPFLRYRLPRHEW